MYQAGLNPERAQLIFWQSEVESIADDLKNKGLSSFTEPTREDDGVGAMLIDPDGHPLYFVSIHGHVRKDGS